jgi:two-component system, OmpR family, sensor kinase
VRWRRRPPGAEVLDADVTAPLPAISPRPVRPGRLRTVSLRRRVTALTLAVLAAVLLLVAVLTDVVFTAQSRADVRAQLAVRANLAGQLAAQGTAPRVVARRAEAPGVSALLVTRNGQRFGAVDADGAQRLPPPADRGDDQVLRRTLADGSQLTLVADGEAVSQAQQRLRRTLALLGLAALAVAGAIMLLVTRVALAPLDAMTALARSITGGDRGRRLAPPRTDTELGRAAAAFDDMLDALEGAEATARAAAERTRRFVADAAHELRTPLAGVQAVTEAAMAPELTGEERERLQLLLLQETRRAARLVDDLLALARIDAGMDLCREPVNLLELARTEAERVRLRAPDRRIDVEGAEVVVPGDGARLGQVLGNLLDNACRHTPGGGRIAVRVWSGGLAVVQVSDDGPGVPRAARERIFDRLVRLDDARTAGSHGSGTGGSGTGGSEPGASGTGGSGPGVSGPGASGPGGSGPGGSGLGLAIARGIARAHGGDLRCVDPPDGRGATFTLTLPNGPGPGARPPAAESRHAGAAEQHPSPNGREYPLRHAGTPGWPERSQPGRPAEGQRSAPGAPVDSGRG